MYEENEHIQEAPKDHLFGHRKEYRYRVLGKSCEHPIHHTNSLADAQNYFRKCKTAWEKTNVAVSRREDELWHGGIMRNTGFSEITSERATYCGDDPWFVEIALTGKCNFACSYCNRFSSEVCIQNLFSYFSTFDTCRHIQITGGEPTLHPEFNEIMAECRKKAKRVGLSTNGTAGLDRYLACGADMFSISLDDYDTGILAMRGYRNPDLVIETIRTLSKKHYVNVGMVIDSLNIDRVERIINFVLSLGVADIKLSTSTKDELMPKFIESYDAYPILSYRVKNFQNGHQMRGWPGERCKIAENDVSIIGEKHYPCLVYFREGGKAIGEITQNVKEQRALWAKHHRPQNDAICSKYCMDFKCEFNGGRYDRLTCG